MTVKELIEHLQTFGSELSVMVKNESLETELPIEDVKYENDGYCKIVICGE